MGRIICTQHGLTGITLVCDHLFEAVTAGRPLPPHETVMIDLLDDPASMSRIHSCTPCMISQGLSADGVLPDFPEGLQPVCVECWNDQVQR